MTTGQSHDEARAEFEAYVRHSVGGDEESQSTEERSRSVSEPFARFGVRFNIWIGLAILAALLAVFIISKQADSARYQSIIAENRYSIGTSNQYWWRYDGLDNKTYDRRRRLSVNDWVQLRHSGVHVTYEEYRAHRFLWHVKMSSGIFFAIGLLLLGRWSWRRLNGEEMFDPAVDDDAGLASPTAAPQASTARPRFGRRAA